MVDPNSVDRSKIQNIEAGNLSNENAERRANTPVNEQSFTSIQAFDGVGEYVRNLLIVFTCADEFCAGRGSA